MHLHPAIVHFPLALLTFALAAEVAARVTGRTEFSFTGWWAQVVGTIGLAAAVATGLLAKGLRPMPVDALSTLDTHEQLAMCAAVAFALLLYWRIARRSRVPDPPGVYLVLFALAVILLWTTGWFGGTLVAAGIGR
jgi:uncharacterized membrane protein